MMGQGLPTRYYRCHCSGSDHFELGVVFTNSTRVVVVLLSVLGSWFRNLLFYSIAYVFNVIYYRFSFYE